MERKRNLQRLSLRKKILLSIGSAAIAVGLSGSGNNSQTEGKAPYRWTPYEGPLTLIMPLETAEPVHVFDRNIDAKKRTDLTGENRDNSPGGTKSVDVFPSQTPLLIPSSSLSPTSLFQETPSPRPEPTLSPKDFREQKIKLELSEINKILDAHPNVFSRKYKKDINLYYPIYKPIADKFHIDWYLIFIVHEKETGASAGTRGFLPSSYYKGAMQRDPILWDEDYVKEAVKELEYLKDLPQRHSDDWREIATGAAILNRNIDYYMHLGKNTAVFNSIKIYSPGSYDKRFKLYKEYKNLFDKL